MTDTPDKQGLDGGYAHSATPTAHNNQADNLCEYCGVELVNGVCINMCWVFVPEWDY